MRPYGVKESYVWVLSFLLNYPRVNSVMFVDSLCFMMPFCLFQTICMAVQLNKVDIVFYVAQ